MTLARPHIRVRTRLIRAVCAVVALVTCANLLLACTNSRPRRHDWGYAQCIDYCDDPPVPDGTLPGENDSCGDSSGQCPCDLGTYLYCGRCPSAPSSRECVYCPGGSLCSSDPCNPTCLEEPEPRRCPASAPIDCGNGSCCQSSHPVCCPGGHFCGETTGACNSAGTAPNPGGGSCSLSAAECSQIGDSASRMRSGGCCIYTQTCNGGAILDSCSDACGNGWYELDGRVYGPCPVAQ